MRYKSQVSKILYNYVHMAALNRKRNKTVSGKLRRSIVFTGWRRNISAREKIEVKELRSKQLPLD